MKRSCILFLFLSSFSSCGVQESPISKESEDSDENSEFVIAFGSCNKQDKEQPLWDDILDEKPDVWIWLGDNIYGDSEDVKVLESKYNLVKSNKQYAILQNAAGVYGIWETMEVAIKTMRIEIPATPILLLRNSSLISRGVMLLIFRFLAVGSKRECFHDFSLHIEVVIVV